MDVVIFWIKIITFKFVTCSSWYNFDILKHIMSWDCFLDNLYLRIWAWHWQPPMDKSNMAENPEKQTAWICHLDHNKTQDYFAFTKVCLFSNSFFPSQAYNWWVQAVWHIHIHILIFIIIKTLAEGLESLCGRLPAPLREPVNLNKDFGYE